MFSLTVVGTRSSCDQYEFFNEAELVAQTEPEDATDDFITVPSHRRKARKSRQLPPELARVEVIHDLAEADKQCGCGLWLRHIGQDTLEQLCVIPQRFFAIAHQRLKYACSCKRCIGTAPVPAQPLPGSQASPQSLSQAAQGLLSEFCDLVCDGAPIYNQPAGANGLTVVYRNDHARRRFRDALASLGKSAAKNFIAAQAIKRYRTLYRLEKNLKLLSVEGRYLERQRMAVPLWDAFLDWAKDKHTQGVAHEPTRQALAYLLNHAQGLRRYCEDGRLPISNIQSEQVAKTIALARKNFLFADTEANAAANAMLYSILESAQANHHHVQRYLSSVLTELPHVNDLADIEILLPWNLTPDEVAQGCGAPTCCRTPAKAGGG